jgi:hypothetical protein
MTEEYEIIREGLISLLCVGDTLNCMYEGVSNYDARTRKHHPTYKIVRCPITRILENGNITINTRATPVAVRSTSMIEVHEGQLFLHDFSINLSREQQIAKMIDVIKYKYTTWENR